MTWRMVGTDVNGRPVFNLSFPRSTAYGLVQELSGRWAWALMMPDPRDDQQGRADSRAEAQSRVEIAAGQRGLIDLEREHERQERIAIQMEDAFQLASMGGNDEPF